jgi:hypothetical protein
MSNVVSGGSVGGPVIQAGTIGQLVVHQGTSAAEQSVRNDEDPWVSWALESSVWDHVGPNRDVSRYRGPAASVAAGLAVLRDQAQDRLSGDPWREPGFAIRFAERVQWLLGEPGEGAGLDLYPAEAALLVLTPFLHQVHTLRAAVRRLGVQPWKLKWSGAAHGSDRAAFEAFTDGHQLLVQRALLHQDAEAPIGWWLFHRWLLRHDRYENSTAGLIKELGGPALALGEVLAPDRVRRVLQGLRRGPAVTNPEYLNSLPADDRLRGPGHQRVRDQRLALLTAFAYTVSVEMTALPDIVAEHLGIPHPVDLDELRVTLEESGWGGSAELPVLRAECTHEAVIEALRAYVARADEVLHAVSRTVRERVNHPVPTLPMRLSADGVCPSDGAFMGWAGFRLDERRVRDLLMGVQLYKDRDLAVRELYQNALDACRYRRARTEYLDRTQSAASYAYEGRISFEQDVDDDGRAYVECRDNGIGMGEAELRGVFSDAGARFAEQPEFLEERARWAALDPPVSFHPNSRFGIGVLSYFMLADEVRVTTCRMGPAGRPGPVLEVSIFGPGHLFRIVRVADEGAEPGTTVRLYLRGGEEMAEWSCPAVLERLLGIAEFRTEARLGASTSNWEPGVLRGRASPYGEAFGVDASGVLVPWPHAPDGAQVIWCERGGGILVDGLVIQPSVSRGVLSRPDPGQSPRLTGVVVNLSGGFAPARLSADRERILDDVSAHLSQLLEPAALHLVESREFLPDFAWFGRVAASNVVLADLVARHCVTRGRRIAVARESFDSQHTGVLPSDVQLARTDLAGGVAGYTSAPKAPDHLVLWRLIAHRPNRRLRTLTELCPELDGIDAPLPALPSDACLMDGYPDARKHTDARQHTDAVVDHVLKVALTLDAAPRAVASRAARLGLCTPTPGAFPDAPVHPARARTVMEEIKSRLAEATATEVDRAVDELASGLPRETVVLLSAGLDGRAPWLSRTEQVPPRHVAKASLELGLPPREICRMLTELGCTPPASVPPVAEPGDPDLLHDHQQDLPLRAGVPFDYGDLFERPSGVRADLERLGEYGITAPLKVPEVWTDLDEELLGRFGYLSWYGVRTDQAMPFAHVIAASRHLHIDPEDVVARLATYDISTSCATLPEGLSFTAALDLLNIGHESEQLSADDRVGLQGLFERSRDMGAPMHQTYTWLKALGIKVVDPVEAVRAALPLVPRADA